MLSVRIRLFGLGSLPQNLLITPQVEKTVVYQRSFFKERKDMAFTHLHVHSEYSLLDGMGKIKEYVDKCKKLGMDSLALTDHGVMYGAVDIYNI